MDHEKIESAGSSPANEFQPSNEGHEAAPLEGGVVADSAESTPAPSSETSDDALFAAVQAAMKPAGGTSDPPAEQTSAPTDTPVQDSEDATAEDPDAKLPFHNHPRWKEVHAQAKQLKEVLPEATAWRQFQQNLERAGLSPQEVNEGLGIMALLKRHDDRASLERARQLIAEHLHNLDIALGNVIPDDLAQRIEAGEVAEDAALELARMRAEANRLSAVRQAENAALQQKAAQEAYLRIERDLAVWDQQQRSIDPDYASKAELYRMSMSDLVRSQGRLPSSSQEAIQWATEAKARVDRSFASRSAPRPTQRTPSSSTASRAVPSGGTAGKSFEDVIAAALQA